MHQQPLISTIRMINSIAQDKFIWNGNQNTKLKEIKNG